MKNKIAVIGAILEEPKKAQFEFNKIVAEYKEIVRGRLGLPLVDKGVSAISLTVVGSMDEINSLTGKLGNIDGVSVKTSISKKEF